MIARLAGLWVVLNALIGGTAFVMFPWFNLTAVGILAVASGIVSGIAVFIVRIHAGGAGGGGGANARATKYSKGARGGDDR